MHPDAKESPRWKQWYVDKAKELAEKSEKKDAKAAQVLVWGHEASGDDPIAPQNFDWADMLHNSQWDYKIGYAQYFKPAASVRSRDKAVDRSYIQAVKRGHPRIHIVYERADGESGWKLDNFVVYGYPDLRLVNELKGVIRDGII